MIWLALDIGGANLKAADGRGWACSDPFPLWRKPEGLAAAVAQLIAGAPAAERIALTMTGELCDAFRTKRYGVRRIIVAVLEATIGRDVFVYLVDGRLVSAVEALERPELAAASNWHALARFASRFVKQDLGLLIDIGSTTTDIIPIVNGQPKTRGMNDTDRLLAGELVYTGVGRTPICAVTHWLPWRDAQCPVAAELFATTADVYVTLGALPEHADNVATADGRPLTKELARERLARMICADSATFSAADAAEAAASVREAQVATIRNAVEKVVTAMPGPAGCVVLSGGGAFLGSRVADRLEPPVKLIVLEEQIGPKASDCGPAHALAVIARETLG
jgi:(4-(4-[2-(gamma-L-glutamylamino)ethyl]phenoxymethyl)furan-2-yl)methanamine synthase